MNPGPTELESGVPMWKRWLAPAAVVAVGLVFLWLNASHAWQDTLFGGDPTHRMNNAYRPITILGNRFWLPFVQVHIWILYLLRLPPTAFQLIPCVYAFLATVFLGLLSLRVNGRSLPSLGFALLLMVCFACQVPFRQLSVALYQEMPAAAFFFALLWAGALKPNPGRYVWALAAVAMTVRENLWIYLFAWTLLHHRSILADARLRIGVLTVWAVPALWLFSVPVGYWLVYGELIRLGTGWPLMINPVGTRVLADVGASLVSVWNAMDRSRALFLLAGLVSGAVLVRLARGSRHDGRTGGDGALCNFPVFSGLAMLAVYGLIVAFDPWEVTQGSSRQAVPLVEHAYVWAIFLFERAANRPAAWRVGSRLAIAGGLLASAQPYAVERREPVPEETLAAQQRVRQLVERESANGQAMVCIADGYWQGGRLWIAPTLYMRREFPSSDGPLPSYCDLGIVRGGERENFETDLTYAETLVVDGVPYGIYTRQAANGQSPIDRAGGDR